MRYLITSFDMFRFILPKSKSFFIKTWYNYLSRKDINTQNLLLMNYGYVNEQEIHLEGVEEKYRSRIQLFHHVVKDVDLAGKRIIEIGCGHGGGIAYLTEKFNPAIAVGLDFSKRAIDFCKDYHSFDNLKFVHGNAESLLFNDESFDIIINIESSHCYNSVQSFFKEVYRVLCPGGYFLFADFRPKHMMHLQELDTVGFRMIKKEDITAGVIRAMQVDHLWKMNEIKENVSGFLQRLFLRFCGTADSPMYMKFQSGRLRYFNYTLVKK